MTVHHLPPPAESIPTFTPVPRRHNRHDGWTPDRQRGFIEALADTGSVKAAAARVAMTSESAYALRRAAGAETFAAAWEAALTSGAQRLADIAFDRATEGVPVPIFFNGEQVGERRRYNDRLLLFLLKHHLPAKFGEVTRPGRFPTRAQSKEDEQEAADRLARDHDQATRRIRERLTRARRLYLATIAAEPDKRSAWETLTGPTDWDRVRDLKPQDNEPFNDEPGDQRPMSMTGPDMLLTAEAGLLADIAGGHDAMAAYRAAVEAIIDARAAAAATADPLPGESHAEQAERMERELVDAVEKQLIVAGWTRNADGQWHAPPEAVMEAEAEAAPTDQTDELPPLNVADSIEHLLARMGCTRGIDGDWQPPDGWDAGDPPNPDSSILPGLPGASSYRRANNDGGEGRGDDGGPSSPPSEG